MSTTKYDQCFIENPLLVRYTVEGISALGEAMDNECSFEYHPITEPFVMRPDSHKHDFDHMLCFIGGDPNNIREFDAEVEICLGEEQEKHLITSTTIVSIPANMLHCPLIFKRVDKPILFMEIALARKYIRKSPTGEIVPVGRPK